MEEFPKKKSVTCPSEVLRTFILKHIEENKLCKKLIEEVPKKWEKYGDFVLFDKKSFVDDIWKKQNDIFWLRICDILKCKRIGIKSKIQSDGFRTPNVNIIVGNDPWVLCIDNHVKYSWNVEKNMFSAGNAPERHRIAKLNCENQIVVDLYAGIGYFTLPFLVHSKASFVHACEWNPAAILALKRNLTFNRVEDKCMIYEGDNQIVCPKNVADRINLGLLPSSETGWKVACNALKPEGGILHVHGNVETKKDEIFCQKCKKLMEDENACIKKNISMSSDTCIVTYGNIMCNWKHKQWFIWSVHVLHSLTAILLEKDSTKKWNCFCINVHYVKSYAPHVHHLVLDVKVEALST